MIDYFYCIIGTTFGYIILKLKGEIQPETTGFVCGVWAMFIAVFLIDKLNGK